MIVLTILIFILIFSVLVLVHEWGHFKMARRAGIKVEEFGIGLPPRAKKIYKDKKGTIYSLNWIPFGGYVRLYGEDSSDPKALKAGDSFASKTKWQRTQVIVAGVVMNFLLAWLLITIGFTVGMKPFLVTQEDVTRAEAAGLIELDEAIYIQDIEDNSPLLEAGVLPGDLIIEVDGQVAPKTAAFVGELKANQTVDLTVLREEESLNFEVQTNNSGKLGFVISDAPYIVDQKTVRYPVHVAAWESVKEVGRLSYLTLDMLGDVVVSLVAKFTVPEGVAGPVGIFQMTQKFTQEGVIALLQFTALLSISLGVINIMPFPALDGGRFLFIIFETILRKRPNAKWEAAIHGIGFILLILLILVITWNDIMNLITS